MSYSNNERESIYIQITGLTEQLQGFVSGKPPLYNGPFELRVKLDNLVYQLGGWPELNQDLRIRVKRVLFAKAAGITSICPHPEVRPRGPKSARLSKNDLDIARLLKEQ